MKDEGSLTDQQYATLVELAKDDERKSNAKFAQMKDDGLLSDQEVATPGESAKKQESKSSKLNGRAQMKESTVSVEEELKWMTKRYSWRYIPYRYQAMAATIVSAFLYYNIFSLIFVQQMDNCGTVMRPQLDLPNKPRGWIWDSFTANDYFSDVNCSLGYFTGHLWSVFFSFGGLAICGLVMRRAIKREAAAQ
jgi:hypothetical protein